MKMLYLDHAATTPLAPDVLEAMTPFLTEHFGNPNSLHQAGRATRRAIEGARLEVAALIGAEPHQIIFTGGGTAADNLAVKGVAQARNVHGKHIITSTMEHPAVLNACRWLETQGFKVTYLDVDSDARIDAQSVRDALKDDTILVTLMLANNEVGTLQPLAEMGQILKDHQAYFHTDAVQAVGHIPIDVDQLNVDLLSLTGHKFYGPKGVGALFVRDGIELDPILHGGGQERNLRSGTENISGIVGLGAASKLGRETMNEVQPRITQLRDRLISGVLDNIEGSHLIGHPTERLPGSVALAFDDLMGESLLLKLDMEGICVSTGSACSSGHMDPSHVLVAMGLSTDLANGSVRITLGRSTTDQDIDCVLDILPEAVAQVRKMAF